MKKEPIRTTNELNIHLFKRLIDLTIFIAQKYDTELAYQAALEGLYIGLDVCIKTKSYQNENLDNYLSWFVKTSIEYKLGYKTKDTLLWAKNNKY